MMNENNHDVDIGSLPFKVSEHKAESPSYFASTKILEICFCWSMSKDMIGFPRT